MPGSRTRSPFLVSNQPRRSSPVEPAKSSSVFTPFSPSVTSIGGVRPGHALQRVLDAQLLALGVEFGGQLVEIVLRARLQFVGDLVVEAFDRGELHLVDIGDFLDRLEAFRGQQLGEHLVDIQRLDEEFGARGEFLLPALAFLGFGQDVDRPAGELRSEAHVLAAAADGERKLRLRRPRLRRALLPDRARPWRLPPAAAR